MRILEITIRNIMNHQLWLQVLFALSTRNYLTMDCHSWKWINLRLRLVSDDNLAGRNSRFGFFKKKLCVMKWMNEKAYNFYIAKYLKSVELEKINEDIAKLMGEIIADVVLNCHLNRFQRRRRRVVRSSEERNQNRTTYLLSIWGKCKWQQYCRWYTV